MKAVILAAGRGTRMKPLTDSIPKPLLPVAGKPIIQHTVDLLEDYIDEFIVVTGYKRELVEEHFSDREDFVFVHQEESLGTADAALKAKEMVEEKTVIVNGDDIYRFDPETLKDVDKGILVSEVENPQNYGVIKTRNQTVDSIVEKPSSPESKLVNTGLYIVEKDFFDLLEEVEKSDRGEFEITDALSKYINTNKVTAVETEEWIPCSYPWNLLEANERLLENTDRQIEGEIADSASINGAVEIRKNAKIRENTVIDGPAIIKSGATVGPGAHIRPGTVIGEDANIGLSEVKNSVMLEGSNASHFNYVGDSYLGRDVNLGAGAKILNLLNSESCVKVEVRGKLLDTGKRKIGGFIGCGARIGAETVVKPGRKVGCNTVTDANEVISENLPSNVLLKKGEIIEDWN